MPPSPSPSPTSTTSTITNDEGNQEATTLSIDICGNQLVLHQSKTSYNCGSTLWSAGLVLARYLEQEKSLFHSKAKPSTGSGGGGDGGLRVLELGAGLGLAGIVCALQGGCREVILTDLESVLPYLQKNARFIPSVAAGGMNNGGTDQATPMELKVLAFPWGQPPEECGLSPPYDLILGADCIYNINQVPIFLDSLLAVASAKSTILIGNEERDNALQAHLVAELSKHFTVKPIKKKKLCHLEGYHDLVQIWMCKLKSKRKTAASAGARDKEVGEEGAGGDEEEDEGK